MDCLVVKLEGLNEIAKLMMFITFFFNTIHVHACCSTKELKYAIVKNRKQYVGNYEWPQLSIEKYIRLYVRFDGLLGCFINCRITWIIHFTVTPSNSLRTSVCGINKRRGVKLFGTSNILLPPPWFSDRCYCILNVEQTGKESKIIKHQSGYNLISVIVLSLLWYQDSVLPVRRFPPLCHPYLLSP